MHLARIRSKRNLETRVMETGAIRIILGISPLEEIRAFPEIKQLTGQRKASGNCPKNEDNLNFPKAFLCLFGFPEADCIGEQDRIGDQKSLLITLQDGVAEIDLGNQSFGSGYGDFVAYLKRMIYHD